MHQAFNQDVFNHSASKSELEDKVYLQMDKLIALVSVQSALDNGDFNPGPAIRNHYSLIIEEHALELRGLLEKVFL